MQIDTKERVERGRRPYRELRPFANKGVANWRGSTVYKQVKHERRTGIGSTRLAIVNPI